MISENTGLPREYTALLNSWGINFSKVEGGREIEGSPERTAARTVVRDTDGKRWILEQIEPDNIPRKKQIAEQLAALKRSGLDRIHPWQLTKENSFFQRLDLRCSESAFGSLQKKRPEGEWQNVDAVSSPRFQTLEKSGETFPMAGNNRGEGSRLRQGCGGQAAFMLRPFVEGVPLDRRTYLNDLWRIDAMTEFLIQLREHASLFNEVGRDRRARRLSRVESRGGQLGELSLPERFSITSYAENRLEAWRKKYSKLAEKLEPSFSKLKQSFFPVHDRLPVAFCHGDFHPLNMVWGEGAIHSVIDWEFCGIKPELYDVALLLGCIGFEDPDNLIKEPVIRLVNNLRGAGFGEDVSWEHLLDLMAMIRYGWMSEWFRRSDREARKMEAVYIDILVDQKDYIQKHW